MPRPKIPRTLLISHFPPGKQNGSMHHYQAAMDHFGDQIVWYSTKPPIPGCEIEGLKAGVPWDCGLIPERPTREPFRSLRRHFTVGGWTHLLARDAARFGRSHGVERVWGAMSLEAVATAGRTARILGVPLVVSAFDDPTTVMRYYRYPEWTLRPFERHYRQVLKQAVAHGVISKAMVEDYRRRYGIEADVLYLGVDPKQVLDPPATLADQETYWIGIVGSVVSEANWWRLVAAVESLNLADQGPQFRILHIGTLPTRFAHPTVESTGWVSGDCLRAALQRLHLCFLNIWFEHSRRYSAQTAFPTKITTYLEAQRPIVAHGPADSQVVRLVADEGLGEVCTEPDVEALASSIRRLICDQGRYYDTISEMKKMVSIYSRDSYLRAVESLLNRSVAPGSKGSLP